MLNFLLFIFGFILLIKGADWLVDGSSSLARRLGIPDLVIGLTIVAFGTSAPELAVNIFSAIKGTSQIALGNVIGSNIANILLILGSAALMRPLKVQRSTTWKEIPLSFLAVIITGLMINDTLIDRTPSSILSRIDGFILLAFFIIFMYYTFGVAKEKKKEVVEKEKEEIKFVSLPTASLITILGLASLIIGGRWVVNNAIWLAKMIGVSETLIGLTIVAVGTSLPELATSVIAAYKKSFDIALGNIVGSNIFNIFLILGVSSIIRPLIPPPAINVDIAIAGGASLILMLAIILSGHPTFFGKRYEIPRAQGLLFLLFYFSYLAYLVYRG
jgi:cation:H+ antiporter